MSLRMFWLIDFEIFWRSIDVHFKILGLNVTYSLDKRILCNMIKFWIRGITNGWCYHLWILRKHVNQVNMECIIVSDFYVRVLCTFFGLPILYIYVSDLHINEIINSFLMNVTHTCHTESVRCILLGHGSCFSIFLK